MNRETMRLTVDLPKDEHRRLKIACAQSGKTAKEFVLEALNKFYEDNKCCGKPNEETLAAMAEAEQMMKDAKAGKKTKYNSIKEMMKDLLS